MVFNKLVAMLLEAQEQPKMHIGSSGTQIWTIQGDIVHREDGPAVIYKEGSMRWYIAGAPHRDDGPADITMKDGKVVCERWYKRGQLHREDGPATIHYLPNGVICRWYINSDWMKEAKFDTLDEYNDYLQQKKFNKELASREDAIFDNDFLDGL